MFSFRSLMGSGLAFKSLVCFESIAVGGKRARCGSLDSVAVGGMRAQCGSLESISVGRFFGLCRCRRYESAGWFFCMRLSSSPNAIY